MPGWRSRPFALALSLALACAWPLPALGAGRPLSWADGLRGTSPRMATALGRTEALGLAGTLGGGVAFAELGAGQLLIEAVRGGARAALPLGDGLGAEVRRVLPGLAGADEARLVMTATTARALGPLLHDLAAVAELRVAVRGLPPLPVRALGPAGQARHFVELHPGLVAPLDLDLPEGLALMLAAPVRQDAIRVLPLFHASEVEVLARLAAAGGDRVLDLRAFASGRGGLPAEALRDRHLIAIGHVEGDAFVLRDAAGAVARTLPMAELEARARAAGAALLLSAGCACFAGGAATGFLHAVTDVEMAGALRAALRARTQAELLSGFGQPGNPYVITPDVLRQALAGEAARLDQLARHAGLAGGATFTLRVQGRAQAATGGLLQGLLAWYGIGAAMFAAMARRSRARFLALFPVLPNPLFRPAAHRLAWLAREALFLAAAPIVGGLVLILLILTGAWTDRDDLHRIGWSLFLRPPDFLVPTTLLLGTWALTLAALGLPLLAILAVAETPLRRVVEASPAPVLGLGAVAVLLAVMLAVRATWWRVQAGLLAGLRRWPRAGYALGVAALPAIAAWAAIAALVGGAP